MAYSLITTPQTEKDIEKAVVWYAEIRKELAKQFLAELTAVKEYIQKNPNKIQIRYGNIRIAFLKKFPHGVHYSFNDNTITILAVFHTSDSPYKWENR